MSYGSYDSTCHCKKCDTILVPMGTRMIRHVNKGYVCIYVCIIKVCVVRKSYPRFLTLPGTILNFPYGVWGRRKYCTVFQKQQHELSPVFIFLETEYNLTTLAANKEQQITVA